MEKGNGLRIQKPSFPKESQNSFLQPVPSFVRKENLDAKKMPCNCEEPKVTGRQQKKARFHPEALYSKVWWKHLQTNAELSAKPNFAAD